MLVRRGRDPGRQITKRTPTGRFSFGSGRDPSHDGHSLNHQAATASATRSPSQFLLHANTDRLFALWQLAPGQEWRLDPDRVYGRAGSAPAIVSNLEPWAGGEGLRPWAPPDNQQLVKSCMDPSVVTPLRYDTNPVTPLAVSTRLGPTVTA